MQAKTHAPAPRILSAGAVRVTRERGPAQAASNCDAQPKIHTREHGGVIREIIVTCSCGQTIVLDCDYGASSAAPMR
jgi:hypothetical protein